MHRWLWSLGMLRKGYNIPELVFQFLLVNQLQSKVCFSREGQGTSHRCVTFQIQSQDFLVMLAACFSEPFVTLQWPNVLARHW